MLISCVKLDHMLYSINYSMCEPMLSAMCYNEKQIFERFLNFNRFTIFNPHIIFKLYISTCIIVCINRNLQSHTKNGALLQI